MRRRSGRTVSEKFVLLRPAGGSGGGGALGKLFLLSDHAMFAALADAHNRWARIDARQLGSDRLEVYERVGKD